jgi:hypothetical protein
MSDSPLLSHAQAHALLRARDAGQDTADVSLDLGRTTDTVTLDDAGVSFPDGQRLAWEQVYAVGDTDVHCFALEAGTLRQVQVFSPQFNRSYSLMPTAGAPTLLIAGFPMHRVKGTDPHRDTLAKIRAIGKLRGHVLDTATGLGYTAIEAARTASHVTTIELDPTTLEIARANPWSRELFDNPTIEQIIGDTYEVVQTFEDGTFSRIIHDPPIFSLAGELYSGVFYQHLFRVLKQGGRVFHYIGNLESKSGGGVARGVVRRLREAGFERVTRKPDAFGVVAYR